MIFAACVAFVIPNWREKAQKRSAGAESDLTKTLIGGANYYISVCLFTIIMIIRLIGIVWWLSFAQGSIPAVIMQPNGQNITTNVIQDYTPQLNASWPIGVVFWTLSGLLFVFFALIVNDGYGYYFLHIFHQEKWNSFIGLGLLIGALISAALTIICFGLAFTWPGYGTVFNATVVIPLVTEFVWLVSILAIWARQFIITCCYYGSAPHLDKDKPEPPKTV